jgi:pilus assembly protein CpaE
MARQPTEHDPFDLGFDAADEFTSAGADPWRSSAPALTPVMDGLEDPFVDFPPARPRDTRPTPAQDPFAAPAAARQAAREAAASPGAQQVAQQARASAPAPVAAAPVQRQAPPAEPAPVHHDEAIHEAIASGDAALGEMAVPRITIHAFCVRSETSAMVEAAAADRRMARASTIVRVGGLAAAVELYQNQPTPSLVHGRKPRAGARVCCTCSTPWPRSATRAPRSWSSARPTTSPSIAS